MSFLCFDNVMEVLVQEDALRKEQTSMERGSSTQIQ
jgi:hypothetical protein